MARGTYRAGGCRRRCTTRRAHWARATSRQLSWAAPDHQDGGNGGQKHVPCEDVTNGEIFVFERTFLLVQIPEINMNEEMLTESMEKIGLPLVY